MRLWVAWVLAFAAGGYALLALIHKTLTVNRFNRYEQSNAPEDDGLTLNQDFKHIFWFVQLSDIHVSKFYDSGRIKDLSRFCHEWVPVIRPRLVLVTGDLTDGKDKNAKDSTQYEQEWRQYYEAVAGSPVIQENLTEWLDIRGNHDTFNVPFLHHPRNFHLKLSIHGRQSPGSYAHHVYMEGAKYSFLGLDFTPMPGPKRPFNFFGYLNDAKVAEIQDLQRETVDSNMTICFGHYPTSTVANTGSTPIDVLLNNSVAYLSGHLHTSYGWVPAMHAIQDSGTLELEAGDWRDARRVRLLAVDHGLLSFTDQSFTSGYPVLVITNPKNALYLAPLKEPIHRIFHSSHIRILAFSDTDIPFVEVYIDREFHGKALQTGDQPLYTIPWNPKSFSPGQHIIEIRATDEKSRTKVLTQPFSTHGHSHLEFRFVNRLILLSDITTILRGLFGLLYLLLFIPLLIFRWRPLAFAWFQSINDAPFPLSLPLSFAEFVLKSILYVSSLDVAFYSILGILLYMVIGPWFMAHVTEDQLGLVFLYGIYVEEKFLPMNITQANGIGYLLLFMLPYLINLGRCICGRLDSLAKKHPDPPSQSISLLCQTLYLLKANWFATPFFGYHLYQGIFNCPYGFLQLLLAPVRTWFLIYAIILRMKAKRASLCSFSYEALVALDIHPASHQRSTPPKFSD